MRARFGGTSPALRAARILLPEEREAPMLIGQFFGASEQAASPPVPRPVSFPGMVWIRAATYRMGSDHHYLDERPAHHVSVDGFWIDEHPVTNREFAAFVADTGYVTCAERAPRAEDYPGARPHLLYAGSLVFVQPATASDSNHCWRYVRDATWRRPEGEHSSLEGRHDHPVVHVAFEDALAYAHWAGKALPTEAEWELAARGGLDGATYAWGDQWQPYGQSMANTWQGDFPWQNRGDDGFFGTSPVGAFPPNGYGVFDMIGNTWEWTTDWYATTHPEEPARACCISHNPLGPNEDESIDPHEYRLRIPRKVLKGSSYLCAPNYCRRYRPAARFPQPIDTSTCHVGFRCVARVPTV